MGSAEGLCLSAGSLRVSLRYNFFPFLARKGAREPALSKACGEFVEPSKGWSKEFFSALLGKHEPIKGLKRG